jgi:hypothetical protein
MHLSSVGQDSLSAVPRAGGDAFVLHATGRLAQLNGLVIDLRHNTLDTPLGRCVKVERADHRDVQGGSGPWRGYIWSLVQADAAKGITSTVRFDLGRLEKDRRGMIYYEALVGGQQGMLRHDLVIAEYAAAVH